jgi:hypothetical protein
MRWWAATLALLSLSLGACGRDEQPAAVESKPTVDAVAAVEPGIDPVSGLIMTGDWQLVRGACTACHSGKQITQQRGTAEQWLAMIRWMQEKQNLWQFDPVTEEKIINYLAENYPPRRSQRRAPLTGDQLPPNPYSQ